MAEQKKPSVVKELTKGFLKENPVLRLVLGTCPTLATSTSVVNGIGMGIAATIVLICSNVAISALRKVIPEKARIPAYIVIIASFVTMVQMLVKAFVPALDKSLGVFLPLIVVNCIILGRAEAYASKNPVLLSAIDGLGMGIGFTAALFCMGTVREILGAGTFLSGLDTMIGGSFKGFDFTGVLSSVGLAPMTLFILPAGGFFVFGILMALANKLAERNGLQSATLNGCKGCPHASFCGKLAENGEQNTSSCVKENEIKETEKKAAAEKKEENKKSEEKTVEKVKEAESKEIKSEEAAENTEKAAEEAPEEKDEKSEEKKAEDTSEEKTEEAHQTEEAEAEAAVIVATEDEKEEPENTPSEEANVQTFSQKKNSGSKKDRKNKKKTQTKSAFAEPVPEVIPDFIKKDIEENKKEEGTEE